jgi:hypothetical protein
MRNQHGSAGVNGEKDGAADESSEENIRMSQGELTSILRGGTGALVSSWDTDGDDGFQRFLATSVDDLLEAGRKRDEDKDKVIRGQLGEEDAAAAARHAEDEEKLLLQGIERVQAR